MPPSGQKYLVSRTIRGRWFHYYQRGGRQYPLGVNGLHPSDPKVLAAWAVAHTRYEEGKTEKPASAGSLEWAIEIYRTSDQWRRLSAQTKKNREAIFARYKSQFERPIETITWEVLQKSLYKMGGFAALNHRKALRPIFEYHVKTLTLTENPFDRVKLDKPKTKGFATAGADEIAAFQKRWKIGTTERLIFDLALFTGAARADLCKLSRANITGDTLTYRRQKSGVIAEVPMTAELRAVIARTPDISPAFLLTAFGKPYTAESLGNRFGDAARAAGIVARLHGLRKAHCVYWAETGATAHQIAAMAGHSTLSEVERYTRAADRSRIVKLLMEG